MSLAATCSSICHATAANLLEYLLTRDNSPAAAGAALPALRTVAAAVVGTDFEPAAAGMLARALERIDPAAAERQSAQVLAVALDRQNYRIASAAASHLVEYRARAGRLGEALQLADQAIGYTRRARLGPWTQLGDEVRRLRVLILMGQPGEALAEVQRLREHMEALPATSDQLEGVTPWSIREMLFTTGNEAALRLRYWDQAIELNAAALASMRARGAPAAEIARVRLSDHGPMIMLGRADEALGLLMDCREVFEQAHDIAMLGVVFGALAGAEGERGCGDVAVDLACEALRYNYLAGDVNSIRISHYNLGEYLRDLADQPDTALAHHLAAALLHAITGAEGPDEAVISAADDLKAADDAAMPADVTDLCRRVGAVPGVDLGRFLAELAPDPQAVQGTLEELIGRAHGPC